MAEITRGEIVIIGKDEATPAVQRATSSFQKMGEIAAGIGIKDVFDRALSSVVAFAQGSLQAFVAFQNAQQGVQTVAKAFGQDVGQVEQAIKDYIADGLVPVADASQAFKNLLSTGMGLPQTIDLLNAMKDTAAFNRQSFYDLGGAVRATTEGIKNQNSILADASGITKNLSVIMAEYGFTMQDLSDKTKKQNALQALYKGWMSESAFATGDHLKLLETYSGQMSVVQAQYFQLQAEIGKYIAEGMKPLVEWTGKAIILLREHLPQIVDLAKAYVQAALSFAEKVFPVLDALINRFDTIVKTAKIVYKTLEAAHDLAAIGKSKWDKLKEAVTSTVEGFFKVEKVAATTKTTLEQLDPVARAAAEGMALLGKNSKTTADEMSEAAQKIIKELTPAAITQDIRDLLLAFKALRAQGLSTDGALAVLAEKFKALGERVKSSGVSGHEMFMSIVADAKAVIDKLEAAKKLKEELDKPLEGKTYSDSLKAVADSLDPYIALMNRTYYFLQEMTAQQQEMNAAAREANKLYEDTVTSVDTLNTVLEHNLNAWVNASEGPVQYAARLAIAQDAMLAFHVTQQAAERGLARMAIEGGLSLKNLAKYVKQAVAEEVAALGARHLLQGLAELALSTIGMGNPAVGAALVGIGTAELALARVLGRSTPQETPTAGIVATGRGREAAQAGPVQAAPVLEVTIITHGPMVGSMAELARALIEPMREAIGDNKVLT